MRDILQLDFLENSVTQMSGYNNLSKCHLGNSPSNRMRLIFYCKTSSNCELCHLKTKTSNANYRCYCCNVYLQPK
jgi:hypothetical protein